jgi:hypothetical protein
MSSVTGTTASTSVAPLAGAVQSAEAAFAQALSAARGNGEPMQGSAPRAGDSRQDLGQDVREYEMELVFLRNELASLELMTASEQGGDQTRPGARIGERSTDPEGDPSIQQGSLAAEVGRLESMAAARGSNNQANNIEARIMEVQTRLAELKARLSAIRSA